MRHPRAFAGIGLALAVAFVAVSCSESVTNPAASGGPESPAVGFSHTGNGAPSGSHYTLNIIGVPKGKSADMDANSSNGIGRRIFVPLWGNAKIHLCESGVDAGCEEVNDFAVLDANGTDRDGALFALPNPDPDDDGTTVYSVFARALGSPGGSSIMTTCAEDPVSGETICSTIELELERDKGRSKFDNVSRYLLYIIVDLDDDGDTERIPLFDDALENYFWDYDNNGLKLAQLRFYPCTTTVDEDGNQTDSSCELTGNGS